MQETGVQFLGREDPLEKEMATHSSNLAWKIPRTEEPGRLQSMGSQKKTDTTWQVNNSNKGIETKSPALSETNLKDSQKSHCLIKLFRKHLNRTAEWG